MKTTTTLLGALLISFSATAAPIQLTVTLGGKTLDVKSGGKTVASYQVSPGLAKHPTPTGQFSVRRLVWNPTWVPPKAGWAKGKKAKGAGDPKNPMKVVKIFFKEPDYYIHGTADEHLLGDPASHGCIRMSSADAYALARLVMENGGAKKPDAWYQQAMTGKSSQTVKLPQPVGITITK
jgi:lipoprotein-anchoring transpeptidase ErfK/SrfK